MRALHIRSGETGQVIDLPAHPSLAQMKELVGGYLEGIGGAGWSAYLDEEGKLEGKPENVMAHMIAIGMSWRPLPGDFLVGDVVFLGGPDEDGNDTEVPDSVLRVWKSLTKGTTT